MSHIHLPDIPNGTPLLMADGKTIMEVAFTLGRFVHYRPPGSREEIRACGRSCLVYEDGKATMYADSQRAAEHRFQPKGNRDA